MQLTFDIGFLSLLNYYLVHFIHSCVNYIGLVCTGWPKNGTFCTPYKFIKYLPIFKLFFTVGIKRKFVIILSLKSPPHL